MPEPPLTAWYVGYIVTAVVVLLVVALVAVILMFARRSGSGALRITEALDDLRLRTASLQQVGALAGGLDEAAEALARIRAQRGAR